MQLICVTGEDLAVTDLLSNTGVDDPRLVSDIVIPLSVAVANRNPAGNVAQGTRYFDPVDITGWTIRVAVGNPNAAPFAGTFTLQYGANTTSALSYSASASAIQAALNALTSVTTDGGVIVAAQQGEFIVSFNTTGDKSDLAGDGSGLGPLSVVEIGKLVSGSATLKEIQTVRLLQNPAALVDLDTITAPASVIVTEIQAGGTGVNAKYGVTLSPAPYDGQFSLTVGGKETSLIDWDASASDVQAALAALSSVGSGNVSVSQIGTSDWIIGFTGSKAATDMGAITGSAASLLTVLYLTGDLDLRTPEIELLLNGQASVQTYFQIVGYPTEDGDPVPLLGPRAVTLYAGIVTNAYLTPLPVVSFYTADQSDARFAKLTVTGKYRFKTDGSFQLYNSDQSKYHSVLVRGSSGSEYLTIGSGES